MTKDEAMRLALNFLEDGMPADMWGMDENGYQNAIAALRQALEQPEQGTKCVEPVAWMTNSEQDVTAEYTFSWCKTPTHDTPLYTAPPKREWVGLTDEELISAYESEQAGRWGDHIRSLRAIEAKLKEKNT